MPQVTRYHPLLAALHWALAVLIIADLTIGTFVLVHIPNTDPKKLEGLRVHSAAGLLILTFMLVRLGVRLKTKSPPDAPTGSQLLDRIAWLSHRMLYVAVVGMALSGLAMALQVHLFEAVFQGHGTLPATLWVYSLRPVHQLFARALMALIALHILGASFHVFVRRDGLLGRMGFGSRRVQESPVLPHTNETPPMTSSRAASVVVRVILILSSLLLGRIASRSLIDPVSAAQHQDMVLNSGGAIVISQVNFGAFPLAIALFALGCAFSRRAAPVGLGLIVIVAAVTLAVRLVGVATFGGFEENRMQAIGEVVLLVLSGSAMIWLMVSAPVSSADPAAARLSPD
jgi:cytochrome b561